MSKTKLSPATLDFRLREITRIAYLYEWKFARYQKDIEMLSFIREQARINIYLTTMTVATAIHHPFKGKTQLFRRDVSFGLLKAIMRYPRVHTKKGYYYKNELWKRKTLKTKS